MKYLPLLILLSCGVSASTTKYTDQTSKGTIKVKVVKIDNEKCFILEQEGEAKGISCIKN